jgi:A/G-specific adenine glycosylase
VTSRRLHSAARHLEPGQVRYFRRHIKSWFVQNRRRLPWRQTQDPYLLLLAEFLLQQTDVAKAAMAYLQLSKQYPTVGHLARARPRSLQGIFAMIGLSYRAERLSASARWIRDQWGSRIPQDPRSLMKLPGVGRYMAYAICSGAFGRCLAAVDTNVARILERFFAFRGRGTRPRDDPMVWEAAQRLMSSREPSPAQWNWALLDFGALVCRARAPRCGDCPVRSRCMWLLTNDRMFAGNSSRCLKRAEP